MAKKIKKIEINRKNAFALILLTFLVFLLVSKLMTPTKIQISIIGESTVTKTIPDFYSFADVTLLIVFSVLIGISSTYIILSEFKFYFYLEPQQNEFKENTDLIDVSLLKNNHNRVNDVLSILKGNEREITKMLLELGELNQAELASRADIPKSTLSRTLADLEKRGVIIRYENGMSKMVKLADALQK